MNRYFAYVTCIVIALVIVSCAGGASLSEEEARNFFIEERGDSIDPDSVTINGMIDCRLDDEDKVQFNIDQAWLVNYQYVNVDLEQEQNLVLVVGEKDGEYKTVQQGECP